MGNVAVLVEALVFVVIDRSCSEDCEFDSHYRPSSFLIFNSRPIMYNGPIYSKNITHVMILTGSFIYNQPSTCLSQNAILVIIIILMC